MASGTCAAMGRSWSAAAATSAAKTSGRTALLAGLPAITGFTATPAAVSPGEAATLSWVVSDADALTLDGGPFANSDVTGQTTAFAANLTQTTIFTLTASNAQGSTDAQVTVGVGAPGAPPFISEFLAINDGGLEDGDGDASDWIEIFNPDLAPVSLNGWYLTDDPANLTKWQLPAVSVPGVGYLVVFASGKDRSTAGAELHTSFKLDGDGEYLALVMPDGTTVADAFSPAFPPQQPHVSHGSHGSPPERGALFPPTPGAPNSALTGPVVRNLTENPDPVPGDADPIVVRAEISPGTSPVVAATLHYRVMFAGETAVPMNDSGGGVYTATIPASASAPGEMVRWYVTAEDQGGDVSRAPLFADPGGTPEYHGTVIADPGITTQLPVMHRFVENPSGTETRSGTRGAFFYNGEFFDNIFSRARGGTSINWPKKSYKIDFNDGHHFRFRDGVPRVDEINLNTTYTDKSYVRAVLSYEHQRDAGMPSPEAFLVHLRQNGAFWNVAVLVEQPDRDFLRRWDLDPDGALYKGAIAPTHYEPSTPLSRWEKKTRRHEDKSDLDAFIDGIAQTGGALEGYLFDNVDLPTHINYMATTCITQNIDGSDKNHYLYRDSDGSGEWTMLPWDLDLTFGPNALNTDAIVSGQQYASHPYIGARPYTLSGGKYNHFLEVIVADPRTRAMLNRRIRSLIDRHLSSGYFQSRIDELVAQIGPDVLLDKATWGGDAHFGTADFTLEAAADRIKNEYLTPRVPYLTVTEGQSGSGTVLIPEATAPVTALVPTGASLGDTWKLAGFDDSGWLSGANAVGYERAFSQSYTPLLGIDLLSPAIPAAMRIDVDGDNLNENNTCYVRYEFDLADRSAIGFLKLRVRYDDGFVAYLNGTRVAGRNDPATPAWNSAATAPHGDGSAVVFTDFDITSFKGDLIDGRNVLAVQAMNEGATSSDMLFSCELLDEASGGGQGAGIPPPQPAAPAIDFGAVEFNPPSGNQDEEYVELVNPNAFAVDVSGWTLAGGISITLKPGTVIPAGDSLYLSPDVSAFRARGSSPTGSEGRFVQGPYSGHLSNFGEPLTLSDAAGTPVRQTTTPAAPSAAQLHLVVSELMYHPAGDPGAEFVELLNISSSTTLDLDGIRFSAGIDFAFAGSAVTSLAPGARVLVVRDQAAFEAVHGTGLPVAGEFENSTLLDNDGERIKLDDATNSTIKEFTYNDKTPWPEAADGLGPSLVLVAPASNPDPDLAASWRPSAQAGGNPDASDATTFSGTAGLDADANGIDDLLDYALGHPPGAHDGLPAITLAGDRLTLSYTRNLAAEDVALDALWSDDLITWQSLGDSFELTSVSQDANGRQTLQFTWPPGSPTPGNRLFVRLTAIR